MSPADASGAPVCHGMAPSQNATSATSVTGTSLNARAMKRLTKSVQNVVDTASPTAHTKMLPVRGPTKGEERLEASGCQRVASCASPSNTRTMSLRKSQSVTRGIFSVISETAGGVARR